MDTLLQDLKYAIRTLLRSPAFTAVAVLTLALGIGANTAIFSVVNGVLLRSLPYGDEQRVVGVWNSWEGTPRGRISPAEYFDYLERVDAFEAFGVYTSGYSSLTGEGDPERIPTGYLTYGVLPALGVVPAIGNGFGATEDRPGNDAVVVLSDGLWRRKFGAARSVIGRRIVLDGRPFTITGVMPPDFRLPDDFASPSPAQLFAPAALERPAADDRGSHFLSGVARLKPGLTLDDATASIAAVASRFPVDMPGEYPPAQRFSSRVTSLHEDVIGDIRPTLLILLGAIGFVLLIACANLTNLFLSRSEGRQREFAVRTALGALRARLVRQSLAESVMVAFAGGIAGVAFAWWGTGALLALRPPDLPRMDQVSVDLPVLLFALALSLVAGVLVGLAPAARAAKVDVHGGLKDSARGSTAGGARQRIRRALVAGEVALALVLLLGAGLLTRSFVRLITVDPGYRTDHLLTLALTLPETSYPDAARTSTFFASLLERVRAQQGVMAAGAVAGLPLTSGRGDINFQIEGRPVVRGPGSPRADWQVVTPGYFEAIGMRLQRGRPIEITDREGTPGVVVINEATARTFWPAGDALGARFTLGGGAGPGVVTVIGIVGDVRQASLSADVQPEIYLAHTQFRFWGAGARPLRSLTLVARTTADPAPLGATLRREIAALDPALPLGELRTMEEVRGASLSGPRFLMLLIASFSAVALLVALIGVYGVMAYSVSQRQREIGVRVALGAAPRSVVGLVLRQGMVPAVAGIALGLAGGLAISRVLRTLLFQVTPGDPTTAIAVSSIVAVVALVACYLPARRAAGVDPVGALRNE